VNALLSRHLGTAWLDGFAALLCAEDAPLKKPHPQVYALTLQRLSLRAHEAIAVEDSPNGVASARGAGVDVLLTRSVYFESCDGSGALVVCNGLDSPAAARGVPAAPRVHWPWLCDVHRRALRTHAAAPQ
jgi:phosphoglycolate phosphatase-like HAD superfamily hydrolase